MDPDVNKAVKEFIEWQKREAFFAEHVRQVLDPISLVAKFSNNLTED